MPRDGPTAKAYPTEEQYTRWKGRADEFDMTVSGFIANMVEAGLKKFDASVEPDETARELREQRNDLKNELDSCRDRVEDLEDSLYRTERASIQRFVASNPGADFEAIKEHLRETVPVRAAEHLDGMEGEAVRVNENGLYYPQQDAEGER